MPQAVSVLNCSLTRQVDSVALVSKNDISIELLNTVGLLYCISKRFFFVYDISEVNQRGCQLLNPTIIKNL